jgi:hypothetical protein
MTADDADLAELGRPLAMPKQRRADLRGAPREPTISLVSTSRIHREAWEAADFDGRRAILGATLAILSIRQGTRGRRTFDTSRVIMVPSDRTPPG